MGDAGPGSSEQPNDGSPGALPGALQWLLLSSRSTETTLKAVVDLARSALARVDDASISVIRDGRFETAAATSVAVLDADKVQYVSTHGPCVQATKAGEAVNVGLHETRERWPAFADAALSVGYRSVLSTPLVAGERSGGALNLYARGPARFDGGDEQTARVLADHAAGVLADLAALAEVAALGASGSLYRQMHDALVTRDLVGWATGILIAGRRCDPDEAFDILRQTSKQSGRSVRDVADDLVAAAQMRQGGDR